MTPETSSPPLTASAVDSTGRIMRIKEHRCLRCGHVWISRPPGVVPTTCASKKCRSPLWNTPRAYRLRGKPEPTRKPSKRKPRKELAV